MDKQKLDVICNALKAESLFHIEDIQSLWSGYGTIARYGLTGAKHDSVIVKHVQLPDDANHPRGWNTDISHQRKIRSYHVESAWYRTFADRCDASCRVPTCFYTEEGEDEFLMVLEDLDSAGFPLRNSSVSIEQMLPCLSWLASFHAHFMHQRPDGLWPVGTYWHLETRPDELAVLTDTKLQHAAAAIDRQLNQASFKTLVHGDAKLANFCFSGVSKAVAAVDFQYVGGGCGMKDVAYFIGSCLYEEDCERYEDKLLGYYFEQLQYFLNQQKKQVDFDALQTEWRCLYPLAWTDFHRFLKGWSPGHWKLNQYSEKMAARVIAQLKDVTK